MAAVLGRAATVNSCMEEGDIVPLKLVVCLLNREIADIVQARVVKITRGRLRRDVQLKLQVLTRHAFLETFFMPNEQELTDVCEDYVVGDALEAAVFLLPGEYWRRQSPFDYSDEDEDSEEEDSDGDEVEIIFPRKKPRVSSSRLALNEALMDCETAAVVLHTGPGIMLRNRFVRY